MNNDETLWTPQSRMIDDDNRPIRYMKTTCIRMCGEEWLRHEYIRLDETPQRNKPLPILMEFEPLKRS